MAVDFSHCASSIVHSRRNIDPLALYPSFPVAHRLGPVLLPRHALRQRCHDEIHELSSRRLERPDRRRAVCRRNRRNRLQVALQGYLCHARTTQETPLALPDARRRTASWATGGRMPSCAMVLTEQAGRSRVTRHAETVLSPDPRARDMPLFRCAATIDRAPDMVSIRRTPPLPYGAASESSRSPVVSAAMPRGALRAHWANNPFGSRPRAFRVDFIHEIYWRHKST